MARCTKIIQPNPKDPKDKAKCPLFRFAVLFPLYPSRDLPVLRYVINIRQYAKFVVALNDNVASTDVEEGMRVGVDRQSYKIMLPLPAKIDPTVTMMQVRLSKTLKTRFSTSRVSSRYCMTVSISKL